MWRDTEIRLMATAGMRLLESDVQGKVMEGCRNVLRESGFLFMDEWASVISGSDEGVYAWIVANYAPRTLGGEPAETTGVIELGGASAQRISLIMSLELVGWALKLALLWRLIPMLTRLHSLGAQPLVAA